MSDLALTGIHLTKEYYKDFLPTDLQWNVTSVSDDFTLYDLFRLVYHADLMIPGIFTTMGMVEFKTFWDRIQLDRDPDDENNVEYLELYWHPDYDVRTTPKTGRSTDQEKINIMGSDDTFGSDTENHWDNPKIGKLPNLMSFGGVGPGCPSKDLDFHECGDDCPKDTGYAVEFTPVNNLAHLPIRVSPKALFFPPYVESDRDFHRTGFELTIKPTLWCFITSIFWELTFAGSTPNAIDDHAQEIQNSVKEVRKIMEQNNQSTEDKDEIDE